MLDSAIIAAQNKPDLQEALRLVPGAQVQQTGARGGQSSIFVRGGDSNFTKVLVDGVAVNDIGGGFDFSQMQTTGVERIEVMRQSNSVVYGSDALTGVINIETRRGRTRIPDVAYTIDGGNLGTFRTNASIGGAVKRVDYFSEYSYFTTDNRVPNNRYRNGTYAGRFGVMLGTNTDLSATLRHIDGEFGSPNGFALYGIADDSTSDAELLYGGVRAQSQWNDRLADHDSLRLDRPDDLLQQPDADRSAVRPVRLRRELPGADGHAARPRRHGRSPARRSSTTVGPTRSRSRAAPRAARSSARPPTA